MSAVFLELEQKTHEVAGPSEVDGCTGEVVYHHAAVLGFEEEVRMVYAVIGV